MEVIVYFIFIQLTLLLIGYTLITRLQIFKDHPGIELSVGYVLSIVFLAVLGTLHYLSNFPIVIIQILYWGCLLTSIILFVHGKLYLRLIKQWFVIVSLITMSSFSICFALLPIAPGQNIIPDPKALPNRNYQTLNTKIINLAQTRANDNYIPYRQAQFFVNRSNPAKDSFIEEWGVHFFQRTPLMGAVTAGYFLALNDTPPVDYTWSAGASDNDHTYLKFQIIAQILNALFLIPSYFFIRKIFNQKVAMITILFLIPSQFFLFNSYFTWPKSFVAFFILLSLLLLISSRKMRYIVMAAIASGLAYLAHDLAVLYIGATAIFLLYTRRFRDMLIIGIGSTIFALPWLITAGVIFHRPSSFILYPLSIKDIPQAEKSKEIIHTFLHTSPLTLIQIRLESLFYLLTPYQLLVIEGNQTILTRLWALGLFSIPGSVGIGLFIPLLLAIIKYRQAIRLWILILVPVILSVIIIGWPRGLGSIHFAEAVVTLLTGVAIAYLLILKRAIWLYLAYAINTIQLGFFMAFAYNFSFTAQSIKDFMSVAFIVTVVALCGYSIYFINSRIPMAKVAHHKHTTNL